MTASGTGDRHWARGQARQTGRLSQATDVGSEVCHRIGLRDSGFGLRDSGLGSRFSPFGLRKRLLSLLLLLCLIGAQAARAEETAPPVHGPHAPIVEKPPTASSRFGLGSSDEGRTFRAVFDPAIGYETEWVSGYTSSSLDPASIDKGQAVRIGIRPGVAYGGWAFSIPIFGVVGSLQNLVGASNGSFSGWDVGFAVAYELQSTPLRFWIEDDVSTPETIHFRPSGGGGSDVTTDGNCGRIGMGYAPWPFLRFELEGGMRFQTVQSDSSGQLTAGTVGGLFGYAGIAVPMHATLSSSRPSAAPAERGSQE